MATQLAIALRNVMQNGAASAAALVDVFPIEPRTGTRLRAVVVPCGGMQRKNVDVAPGRYLIQTILPSGEMIDKEVIVAAGTTEDVLLTGEVTPHEWLGWQRFSLERAMLWDDRRVARTAVTATVFNSNEWLLAPPAHGGTPLARAQGDARTSAFEVLNHPWETRAIAVIRRDSRVDVVVLPVPWSRNRPRTVQLAVPHDADLAISVAIQDPDLGPLLGYLSGGAVTSARKFLLQNSPEWHQFMEMLEAKVQNPFGAAVAGFVLLTTSREKGHPHWHDWIENLANWFEWIPDGAALCGWLALRKGDRQGAAKWFRDSVARGVPVLTGVLRMLHDGLLALDDQQYIGIVRGAVSHADVAQPFVTLRFDQENL